MGRWPMRGKAIFGSSGTLVADLFREQKTDSAPCGMSEKPALRAGMGLQSRWSERKSQESGLTRHEHEAKCEIPAYIIPIPLELCGLSLNHQERHPLQWH